MKIFSSKKIFEVNPLHPGDAVTDYKTHLRFAARDGYLDVKELQQEGKKRMQVEDFLRGYAGRKSD